MPMLAYLAMVSSYPVATEEMLADTPTDWMSHP
jgi:hypothetical protein